MNSRALGNGVLATPDGDFLGTDADESLAVGIEKQHERIRGVIFDDGAVGGDDEVGFLRIPEADKKRGHEGDKGGWREQRPSRAELYFVLLAGATRVVVEADAVSWRGGEVDFSLAGRRVAWFPSCTGWGRVSALAMEGRGA